MDCLASNTIIKEDEIQSINDLQNHTYVMINITTIFSYLHSISDISGSNFLILMSNNLNGVTSYVFTLLYYSLELLPFQDS